MKTLLNQTINNIIKAGNGKIVAIGLSKNAYKVNETRLHILFNDYKDIPKSFDNFLANYDYEMSISNSDKKFFYLKSVNIFQKV